MRIIWEATPDLECEVLALEILPDHVHGPLSAAPRWAPDQLIGRLKGESPRILRQEFPELQRMPSVWSRSYFISIAGNVSSETIALDIADQTTRD